MKTHLFYTNQANAKTDNDQNCFVFCFFQINFTWYLFVGPVQLELVSSDTGPVCYILPAQHRWPCSSCLRDATVHPPILIPERSSEQRLWLIRWMIKYHLIYNYGNHVPNPKMFILLHLFLHGLKWWKFNRLVSIRRSYSGAGENGKSFFPCSMLCGRWSSRGSWFSAGPPSLLMVSLGGHKKHTWPQLWTGHCCHARHKVQICGFRHVYPRFNSATHQWTEYCFSGSCCI